MITSDVQQPLPVNEAASKEMMQLVWLSQLLSRHSLSRPLIALVYDRAKNNSPHHDRSVTGTDRLSSSLQETGRLRQNVLNKARDQVPSSDYMNGSRSSKRGFEGSKHRQILWRPSRLDVQPLIWAMAAAINFELVMTGFNGTAFRR